MGLDWCLKRIDDESASPLECLGAERCDPDNPKHIEICGQIIKSHRDHIVASEKRETELNKDYVEFWSRPDSEIIGDMKGNVLVDTIDMDKFAEILPATGNPFSSMTGIEAFRGKRIGRCDLLPEELQCEAYSDMTPEQMRSYADKLEAYDISDESLGFDWEEMKKQASKVGWMDLDTEIPDGYWEISAIREAIVWLRFWSQFPVKLVAWY